MIPRGVTMADAEAPAWLTERCMRVLERAARQENAALQLAERPDCTEGARIELACADDLRADVAAVASEWLVAESPSDA